MEEQQLADLKERLKIIEADLAASKLKTEHYRTLARGTLESIQKIIKGETKDQPIETKVTVRYDEWLVDGSSM